MLVAAALAIAGKYLTSVPNAKAPNYRPDASTEVDALLSAPTDGGGWVFNNTLGDANVGGVIVNCTHTDSKGSVWTTY